MSPFEFGSVLDDCIDRLTHDESLKMCISAYPEAAEELEPLLELSFELLQLPQLTPSVDAVENGRSQMLAIFDAPQKERNFLHSMRKGIQLWWLDTPALSERISPINRPGFSLLLGSLAFFLVAFFTLSFSASALPGDTLYPVKRGWEDTRTVFYISLESKEGYLQSLEAVRRDEVQAVQRLRRPVIVSFNGRIHSLSENQWIVEGIAIEINEQSEIIGSPMVGSLVEIDGVINDDGTLLTQIALVNDGSKTAVPLPVETVQPTQTVTPEETAVQLTPLEPSHTVTAQPTAEPTATPTSSPMPSSTATLTATPTRESTRLIDPTATPTGDLTSTRDDIVTVEPTVSDVEPTHEPTSTPSNNDYEPEPTRNAEPTKEPTHPPEPTEEPPHEPTSTPSDNDYEPPVNDVPHPTNTPEGDRP